MDEPSGKAILKNQTKLRIIFGSSKVQLEAEKFATSFGSFVGECGGTLGMFIGFNFMMFWDLIVVLAEKSRLLIILKVIKVKIFRSTTHE